MEVLHTTEFDDAFFHELPHLKSYPQMLPFVGRNWKDAENKTLFLGESHYIPGEDLSAMLPDETHVADWYNNNSRSFDTYLSNYINTRDVINKAEKVKEFGYRKPLLIFYNMAEAIKTQLKSLTDQPFTFPFFSFYNYFQRPAFVETDTIHNTAVDDQVAYQTLKKVVSIIKAERVIFVSNKAIQSFYREKAKDENPAVFQMVKIGGVPHPSCAWWNTESAKHGGKTGREKFMELIG